MKSFGDFFNTANKQKLKQWLYFFVSKLCQNDMHISQLFSKCQQFWTESCSVREFYSWAWILKWTIVENKSSINWLTGKDTSWGTSSKP